MNSPEFTWVHDINLIDTEKNKIIWEILGVQNKFKKLIGINLKGSSSKKDCDDEEDYLEERKRYAWIKYIGRPLL